MIRLAVIIAALQGSTLLQGMYYVLHMVVLLHISSSMIIRDLTLRSAASFGSFHLIRLLYDEYIFYLVEQKVAAATGQTTIAVMGEVSGAFWDIRYLWEWWGSDKEVNWYVCWSCIIEMRDKLEFMWVKLY